MENIFLEGFVISIIYVILNFLEMRYYQTTNVENDENIKNKGLKDIFKEGLIVYLSVIFGIFIIKQFKPEVEKIMNDAPPLVFVDSPPF